MNDWHQSRFTYLFVGISVGLVIGLNLHGVWPEVPLHASATQGHENFAIATGLVDDTVEAVYFLDFLTGDLKAAVLNPQVGKFVGLFRYNILSDFRTAGVKNPRYLMVTGLANFPRGRGTNVQFARSAIYVTEATSGQVACYTIPWSASKQAARKGQWGPLIPLDKVAFRTTTVRE